ncbi:MAG: hypothetical protein Q8K79_11225 [Solirubrobacteraceae bacterium]|nr:hypothetical protein [Solirubrobacteraceae bacterium]
MSPEPRTPGSADPPEPDEVLANHPARRHDHEPSDEDDREVILDDPALAEVAIEDDDAPPRPGDGG